MDSLILAGISNLEFQESDLVLLAIIAASISLLVAYARKLHHDLKRTKRMLEDQARLNVKLDQTLSRMLKIDEDGDIDGNRRRHRERP